MLLKNDRCFSNLSAMDWNENLTIYLEIEQILNGMFRDFDYCLTQCIRKPGQEGELHCGCCNRPYYEIYDLDHSSFDLLRLKREELYGKPESMADIKRISPCEYHTLKGCLLKTHKSPVCLGFLCRESIEVLRSEYGLWKYDYLGMTHALEWILTGDLSGQALGDFRKMCLDMARTVRDRELKGP
jgi:hypothetical protein